MLASLALERAKASESEYAAAERLADALAGGHLLREQKVDLAGPFYDLVVALLATDALDIAEADLELAIEEARARAYAPHWAHLTCRRGWVALRRGNLTGAEAAGSMSLELLVNHGIVLGQHFALALLVQTLVEKGEFARADAALRGARPVRGPAAGADVQLPARGAGAAADRRGPHARRARRPARVRPPRRAVGRRQPARLALALAGRARPS